MRSPHLTVLTIGLALCVSVGLAACDTGDGKQLQPVDPDTTTTTTLAALAGDSVGGDAVGGDAVGGDAVGGSDVLDEGAAGTLADPGADDGFELFVPWQDGSPLDVRYTCDDVDIAPSLSWTDPPAGTVQLAFSMVDESTFDAGEPFVHWVLAGVDPADDSLLEGDVPLGAVQGVNSFGSLGWNGPCPPEGEPAHIYRFTMYALNQQVELADGTAADELLDYIDQLAITSTDVTATYQR